MAIETRRSTHKPARSKLPQHAAHTPNSVFGRSSTFIEPEQRCSMIAQAAYFRAEHRGFESGYELEDWLAAESEIDGMLARGEIPAACGD